MKFNDKEYFELSVGGAVAEYEEYAKLDVSSVANFGVLGVSEEVHNDSITVQLENNKLLFIYCYKGGLVAQHLPELANWIRENFLQKNKTVSELINAEFSLAGKIE